jgi:transposase-like protein
MLTDGVNRRAERDTRKTSPLLRFADPSVRAEIVRAYSEERLSAAALADQFGGSPQMHRRLLREEGIKLRGRHGRGSDDRIDYDDPMLRTEVVRLYTRNGLSITQIAARLRGDRRRYGQVLREEGIEVKAPRRTTAADRAEAVRLYTEDGLSIAQTARRLGIPIRTCQAILHDARVQMRPRCLPRFADPKLRAQIVRLYLRNGLTTSQLAARYRCAPVTINRLLRENGVKLLAPRSRLYREHLDDAIDAYTKERLSAAGLANRFGGAATTWLRVLANAGVKIRRPGGRGEIDYRDPALRAKAARLYNDEDVSLAGIAARLGGNKSVWRRALLAAGVEMRPPGGRRSSP